MTSRSLFRVRAALFEAPVRSGLSGAKHLRLASGENGSRVAREGRAAATYSARTRRAASSTSMPQSSRPPVPPRRPRRLGRDSPKEMGGSGETLPECSGSESQESRGDALDDGHEGIVIRFG